MVLTYQVMSLFIKTKNQGGWGERGGRRGIAASRKYLLILSFNNKYSFICCVSFTDSKFDPSAL